MTPSRYHLQSPLLRRVQRHAAVATLFRATHPFLQRVPQEGGTPPFEILHGNFLPATAETDNEFTPSSSAEETPDSEITPVASASEVSAPNSPTNPKRANVLQNLPLARAVADSNFTHPPSQTEATLSLDALPSARETTHANRSQIPSTAQNSPQSGPKLPISSAPSNSPKESTSPPTIQKKSSWSLPNLFRKWQERRSPAQSSLPSMSTRASTSTSSEPPSTNPPILPQAQQSLPVAKAVLPPTLPSPAPIQRETTSFLAPPPSPPSHPSMPTTSVPTAQTARLQPANVQPIAPPPQPDTFSPGATSPSSEFPWHAPDNDTPQWQRLQTIMRKHQEIGTPIAPPESPEIRSEPRAVTSSPPLSPPRGVVQDQTSSALPTTPRPQPTALVPQPPAVPTAQTPRPAEAVTDPSWSRLQTIMRKHQEQQEQEPREESLPDTTSVPPTPSSVSTSSTANIQKSPEPRAPSTSDVPTSSGSINKETPGPKFHHPSMPAVTSPQIPGNEPPIQPAPSAETTIFEPIRREVSLPTSEEKASTSTQETEFEEDEPLPLEQIWPVQRKEQKITVTPPQAQTSAASPSPETPLLHPEEEAILRKVSDSAKTGKPTDSHVELILPRAPRPSSISRPAPQTPVKPAEEDSPNLEEVFLTDSSSPEPFASPATSRPTQPVQRAKNDTSVFPAASPSSPKPNDEPTMISTEIGPLPSDLWHLVGETPPAPATSSTRTTPQEYAQTTYGSKPTFITSTTPNEIQHIEKSSAPFTASVPSIPTTQSPVTSAHTIQRQALDHAQMPSPTIYAGNTPPQFFEAPPSFIQREEMVQPGPAPTTPSAPNQAGPALSEQDLDKLARQVYAEIRHKISIERERTRGWTR